MREMIERGGVDNCRRANVDLTTPPLKLLALLLASSNESHLKVSKISQKHYQVATVRRAASTAIKEVQCSSVCPT